MLVAISPDTTSSHLSCGKHGLLLVNRNDRSVASKHHGCATVVPLELSVCITPIIV